MTHQQFLNIKKILLGEYVNMGGKSPMEFLRGMTWFEGVITNDEITVPLFEDVGCEHKIKALQNKINYIYKEMDCKDKTIEELVQKNRKLEKRIHEFENLTKKERTALRMDAYVADLKRDRERAIQSYLDLKSGNSPREGE